MSEILFHYKKVDPTTWAYLSSLLMIGLFFKFNRFWSVRNLDLVLLILLAPGLLLVHYGRGNSEAGRLRVEVAEEARDLFQKTMSKQEEDPPPAPEDPPLEAAPVASTAEPKSDDEPAAEPTPEERELTRLQADVTAAEAAESDATRVEFLGFIWLITVGGLLLIRMLVDPNMVRRPMLEPNLSVGGLAFLCCSSFVFLMANVLTSVPSETDLDGPRGAEQLLSGQADENPTAKLQQHGPGYAILNLFPSIPTMPLLRDGRSQNNGRGYEIAAKTMAILSQLAIVIGIVAIGYRHFDNIRTGIGAATLYLMLPYTAIMTGSIDHSIPSALLVWAVVFYRRPLWAGVFIGLAAGVIYYPLFLLPLWMSFYWQRGLMRFLAGGATTLALMVLSLAFTSQDLTQFMMQVRIMFGVWQPIMDGLQGVWGLEGWDPWFRLPTMVLFVGMAGTMALWPAQKNLGTLLSCSGAVMVGTQFWHGFGGGLYMSWYLPLILLTIFRPNLEDRIALSVLGEGWFPRRRMATSLKGIEGAPQRGSRVAAKLTLWPK